MYQQLQKDLAYKKLETEKLNEIRSIASMRAIIELACCKYSNNDDPVVAIQEFVEKELNDTDWLEARLTELEGNSLMLEDVRRVLNDLSHELSKAVHNPNRQNMK